MEKKSSNTNLHKAGKAKKDEFYTQLVDIEKELKHYKEQFRDKVVYCNCDDPFESNFFKYFAANFNALCKVPISLDTRPHILHSNVFMLLRKFSRRHEKRSMNSCMVVFPNRPINFVHYFA